MEDVPPLPVCGLIQVCVLKVSAAGANVPGRPPSSDLHLRVLHVPLIRESLQLSAYYSQQVQSIPGEPRRRNKFPRKGHIYIRDVSIGFTAGDLERSGRQEMSSLFRFPLKQSQGVGSRFTSATR